MPRTSTRTYLHNAMRHEGFSHSIVAELEDDRDLLKTMHLDVWKEIQQLTRLIQLQASKGGVRHVTHTPRHAVEDLLVEYFMLANGDSVIVLESARGTFVGFKRTIRRYDLPLNEVILRVEELGTEDSTLLDLAPLELMSSV